MTAAADPVDAVPAAELLAAQPPVLERSGALAEIRDRIESRGRLLVIDDDPTGTQSVHGVPVLTAWSREDLAGALADAGTVFVLTNSRSMPEREAIAVNTEITERAAAIAADEGFELAVASRSDSTMRGHFPQEPDAVADALEAAGHTVDGLLLCPCFLEAGRLTDRRRPVGRAGRPARPQRPHHLRRRPLLRLLRLEPAALDRGEDARGRARRRRAEPRARGHPRRRAGARARDPRRGRGAPARGGQRDGVRRPRGGGARAARGRGGRADLRLSLRPVVRARARRHRAGAAAERGRALRAPRASDGHGLVLVGSHVETTTRQLEHALELDGVHARELSVARLLDPGTREQEIAAALEEIERHLPEREVILYTSRELARAEGSDEALDVGRSVSDALVELVQRLDPGLPLAFCVAKGGITSSDIGTRGFGVRRAEVAGQMLPGTISVWILPDDSAFPGLPYVIFPGNVGEAETLAEVIERLAT